MEQPTLGHWQSTSSPLCINVSKVTTYKAAPEFFLLEASVEGDNCEMELDPDEWAMFIKANHLQHS
jgi:hypothetical protein